MRGSVLNALADSYGVGRYPMLLKLSDKISECLAHAAEARERAKAATDADQKAHFLDMELRWLRLVESYRFCRTGIAIFEGQPSCTTAIARNTAADGCAGCHMSHHRQRFFNGHFDRYGQPCANATGFDALVLSALRHGARVVAEGCKTCSGVAAGRMGRVCG